MGGARGALLFVLSTAMVLVMVSGAFAQCQLGVDKIRFGGQGVLTGPLADYGRQIQMGMQLAIEEINAQGGILGCPLEMRFLDSELAPAVGVRNARQLADWGANFFVGTDSSGVAMALGPVLQELDIIQFFTHAATHRLTEELVYQQGIKQIVRVAAPIYQDAIGALVVKDMPEVKRWATIGADYEYGYVAWQMFKDLLRRHRPDVEFVAEAWAPFFTMDFTPHIASVMAANPDGIFVTPWGGEAVMVLRQALQMGVFDRIDVWWQSMGGSVDALEGLTREIQNNAFQGKLWASARYIHNWPDTETNRRFVEAFRNRWARLPNYSAESAYSSIYIAKAAIEKARSLETDAIIAALQDMVIETPAGTRVFRNYDHQFEYAVPAGRAMWDPAYPIATLGDLRVFDTSEYWRYPPFEPLQ